MYQKLNNQILARLKDIVGSRHLSTGKEDLEDYARDEGPLAPIFPEAVVKPATAKEVAAILKLANRERFPVVARGAGTGVTGGSLALHGGAVISLERMNRILEIDRDNLMAVAEPGIITGELHQAVEKEGLFYPPDPASLDSCSLGGNLAEDAGGPRAVKYGVTRDYVTGVEAFLPSGEIIRYGGKLVKNATGYNILQLLIGSEGTLGIITEITVRLLSKPRLRVDLLVPFSSYQAAINCVSAIIRGRLTPAAIEFMDQKCLTISRQVMEDAVVVPEAAAHLLIEVDGDREDELEREYEKIGEICMREGADDVMVADSPKNQEKIWATRRQLRDSLKAVSPTKSSQDVVVPRMEIPALLSGIAEIAGRGKIEIVCFGHAGDGNAHVNFLKMEMDDESWERSLKEATEAVFALAVRLGGTISGEHGIGITKKEYLPLALRPAAIESMRKIKKAWDPNNILNPGKVLPE